MPTRLHLQHVIESAIDFAIIVTDLDGIVTDWNAGAESLLGWRRDEIVGASVECIFTSADRSIERVQDEMRLALTDGRAADERWHVRKDGAAFWASGETMPLRREDGAHQGYVKILRDRTRQREAGERLRESEDRFRTILDTVETAFAIVEVKYDAADLPVDYRFVEANPAFERQAGVNLRGRWVTEFAPNLERFWFDTYGHVAKTGEPANFENYAQAFGRWFDVRAIRVGDPADRRIAIFFNDTTARRELQVRNAAIQELSDRLRDLTEPRDIESVAAEILGKTLEASLVGYGTVDAQAETISVERDWAVKDVESLPELMRFRDYGSYFDDLRSGATVVVADAALDPRTASSAANLEAVGARAFVNVPLFEHGRFVALLYVGQKDPRVWSDDEVIFMREVTERIRAATERARREKDLRESEARLRRAQEAGGVGLFTVDLATDVVSPTPQFCRLYGLPEQDRSAARAFEECVWREDAHLVSTFENRVLGKPLRDVEYRIRRADTGETRWIARTGVIEVGEDGRPARFVGVARDVTEQRATEERLRASEARALEHADRVQLALAAGAIIGTWVWDLPTDRFTVDEGFARSFGLDPAIGRVGLSLAQVVSTVHPDDRTGLNAAIDEAIARGGAYSHQYRVRRTDGRYYWIEANGRVDHGPDGTPRSFPGVLIDIEHRRAVEEERDRAAGALRALNETLEQRVTERTAELMRAEELLRQSQKMEAVGQLTGGLAHDFNNLLAGITGALELMSVRIDQGRLKDIDKYMVAAQGAAKRAAALTHRLLAFSRRQTLDPRPTDVDALVRGMIELIQRTVGPSIHVETLGPETLWPALVDPSQLENALLNLCINARDAMPGGGCITIETTNHRLTATEAEAHDVAAGEYLSLCVADTGTGMTAEVIAKAFDPFFTTKPIGQGTGLGLSMIYGFASQSGGEVRISSEVGRGTRVCIFLPRFQGDVVAEAGGVSAQPVAFAESDETVLIVDDEPTVRMLVTDVMEDLGYTVIEAADSVAGLKVLRSDVRIDLLITDVGLPGGVNGRQMADAGRMVRPHLKTLFITGYAENAAIGTGDLQPGMEVLTKPFAVETLAARVRGLMATPSGSGASDVPRTRS